MRIVIVTVLLTIILSAIGIIFWFQEAQYLLPTPIPKNYVAISPREYVNLDTAVLSQPLVKPTLFHFFSPECPCSRFNLKHFLALKKKYQSTITFYAVVTDNEKASSARKSLDPDIIVLIDKDEKLAKACGVYSTPQAAILQTDNSLFFRGNYNRARYCTDKNSNFVQMALDSLVAKKSPPFFSPLATNSYGCILSQTSDPTILP
ncbi:MAG TPA: hypothetical protein VEW65_16480 [Chryseolinea sp.]|nr:hypothetical protein [Chryseolinea sp.]HZB14705.1 hypothetical protein [Chryseolinea sp.]